MRRGRVGTVMTAYNQVNGDFAGASRPLIRDTLFRNCRIDLATFMGTTFERVVFDAVVAAKGR